MATRPYQTVFTAHDLKRAYQNCGFEFHRAAPATANESKGPCPFCQGEDRFHIKEGDTQPLMYCRQCEADFKDFLAVLGLITKTQPPAPSAPRPSRKVVKMGTEFTPPVNAKEWRYCNPAGEPVLSTFRWSAKGGKNIRQATPDGNGGYQTGCIPEVRPLLYSEHLARLPKEHQVLIVEGETCVDEAIERTNLPTTTWPGGTGGADKADLSVLEGRPVILWPDADEPGKAAMRTIAKRLPKSCQTYWVSPPKDAPKGWDIADADAATCKRMIQDAKPYKNPDAIEFEDLTKGDGEPINWLWHEFIPEGEITVLAGMGGAGKSTLALTFAAIVASGAKWPDGSPAKKGRVVVMSTEDSLKKVQKPRCQAAIQAIGATDPYPVKSVKWERHHSISKALPELMEELAGYEHPPALLIIDPVIEIMGRGNSNAATDVRESLHPLQNFAARTGMAILGVTHLAKYTSEADAVERVLGSSAWTAKPRMVLLAHHDKTNSDDARKLLRTKSNLGPNDGGFAYKVAVDPQDRLIVKFGDALTGDADSETKRSKGLTQDEIDLADELVVEQTRLFHDGQRPDWGLFPSTAFNAATRWHPRKAKEYRELRGYATRQAKKPHNGYWWYEEGENDPEST